MGRTKKKRTGSGGFNRQVLKGKTQRSKTKDQRPTRLSRAPSAKREKSKDEEKGTWRHRRQVFEGKPKDQRSKKTKDLKNKDPNSKDPNNKDPKIKDPKTKDSKAK